MEFGELTIDYLIDTGALKSTISVADLRKISFLAPQKDLNEVAPPDFQRMVANRHLERPCATVEFHFEVGDFFVKQRFIVITNLTKSLFGLLFLQTTAPIQTCIKEHSLFFIFHANEACRQHVL